MPEPQTEAGNRLLSLPGVAEPIDPADGGALVHAVMESRREARDAALADIAMRVETEWYNGNVSEGARDRILKGLSRPDLNAALRRSGGAG